MISYTQSALLSEQAVQALYDDNNWTSYTRDMAKLMDAIRNSLAVISAWDGDTLVGLVRAVGDGQTILYIQDILVLKKYKRRGIGSNLMSMLLKAYSHIRQKVLLTDEARETRGFYEANGFESCDKGQLVAFVRFDRT